jgi:hypothetical protein
MATREVDLVNRDPHDMNSYLQVSLLFYDSEIKLIYY